MLYRKLKYLKRGIETKEIQLSLPTSFELNYYLNEKPKRESILRGCVRLSIQQEEEDVFYASPAISCNGFTVHYVDHKMVTEITFEWKDVC